jgi:hypothetical protein
MKVDLIFDRDCPNVEATRANLKKALVQAGLPPEWKEWNCTADDTPAELRGFGSPTVLINGIDVTGEPPSGAACCRLYRAADGRLLEAPAVEMLIRALHNAEQEMMS